MELNLELVKNFIEQNKENQDVSEYLKGFNPLNIDIVKKYLNENEDGRKYLDSEKDRHFTKGLETWKKNNLDKLIDEEITKRFPNESEEQKRIKALEAKIAETERKAILSELKVKAKEIAIEKKLPLSLVDYFLGNNEEELEKNLQVLESSWKKEIDVVLKEKFKDIGTDFEKGNDNPGEMTQEKFNGLSQKEITQIFLTDKPTYDKFMKNYKPKN